MSAWAYNRRKDMIKEFAISSIILVLPTWLRWITRFKFVRSQILQVSNVMADVILATQGDAIEAAFTDGYDKAVLPNKKPWEASVFAKEMLASSYVRDKGYRL